jgi:hypothetical protein
MFQELDRLTEDAEARQRGCEAQLAEWERRHAAEQAEWER